MTDQRPPDRYFLNHKALPLLLSDHEWRGTHLMILGREPARWIGLIVTLILAVVQTLLGEGLISDVAAGQVTNAVNAVAQLAVLLAPLAAGFLIREQVYSPETTQKIADRAAATGNTNIGEPPTGPITPTGPVSG